MSYHPLTFNAVQFEIVDRNNQPWIRGYQIGSALGYDKPNVSIPQLYARHADEFTDAMTAVVTLSTEGGPQDVRIFSLRGCHLLAMFARTPVAKQFRKWVLDVLDKLAEQEGQVVTGCNQIPTANDPLTPDQQCTLKSIVKGKIEAIPETDRPKGLYPQVWSRFNNHFRIARYSQLPQCRLSEAIEYLMQMDVMPKKELSATDLKALPLRSIDAIIELGFMPYDPSPISHTYPEDRELNEMFRTLRSVEGHLECMVKAKQMPPIPAGRENDVRKLRETILASCFVARRALGAIFELGRQARREKLALA